MNCAGLIRLSYPYFARDSVDLSPDPDRDAPRGNRGEFLCVRSLSPQWRRSLVSKLNWTGTPLKLRAGGWAFPFSENRDLDLSMPGPVRGFWRFADLLPGGDRHNGFSMVLLYDVIVSPQSSPPGSGRHLRFFDQRALGLSAVDGVPCPRDVNAVAML